MEGNENICIRFSRPPGPQTPPSPIFSKKKAMKVVVIGTKGSGKSSFVDFLRQESFPVTVPAVVPAFEIPINTEDTIQIIDTSARTEKDK